MEPLEKALSCFVSDPELIQPLSKALLRLFREKRMSFQELGEVLGEDPSEMLLIAGEWRLILPVTMTKTSAWEDRLFEISPFSVYEIPNVVAYLVREADETGYWDPEGVLKQMFTEMEVDNAETLALLTVELCKRARSCRITAREIGKICRKLGLSDSVDTIIAIFKGTCIMSPKLGSISEVLQAGSPIYEMNPCVCINVR